MIGIYRIRNQINNHCYIGSSIQKMSETSKRLNRFLDILPSIKANQKMVIDNKGNKFNSLVEASIFWSMSVQAVCDILKGRTKQSKKGIIFIYV